MLFPRLRFQHGPPQIPEEFVLPHRSPQWLHRDLPPSRDVPVMRLRRPAPKEAHNHIVVGVMAEVSVGYIPKETAVSP